MLMRCIILLVIASLHIMAHGQVFETPRDIYRIQLGVNRKNMNSKVEDYRAIMSKADFELLTGLGVLRKADVFNVSPSGQVEENFQRLILGDYIDETTVVYVWTEIRKLGAKYDALGFDQAFIYGNSYVWNENVSMWRTRSVNRTRYTIQIASVSRISSDDLQPFILEFEDIFFKYENGLFKIFVGLFEAPSGPQQTIILNRARSLGYSSAFIHTLN